MSLSITSLMTLNYSFKITYAYMPIHHFWVMLVFIDESGDPGLILKPGTSKFFTVAFVIFEDHDEAFACDQRITLLKKEIGWKDHNEFHFKRNSHVARKNFLYAVSSFKFSYYAIAIDKQRLMKGTLDKKTFYQTVYGLVLEKAEEQLNRATIIIDQYGSLDFKLQLSKYLKAQGRQKNLIKKVKMQRSHSNNLLQLADYIAGVVSRSIQRDLKYGIEYRKIIKGREKAVWIWPQ